jgi:hypothetical protein
VASLGRRSTTTLVLCLLALSAVADEVPFSDDLATADLGEIDRKLNNPLTDLWSLTFQENYSLISGDDIEDTYSNTFFFQPALPVPVGKDKDKIFIARPVFPLVRTPVVDPSQPGRVERHESGFGDMQVFAMVGPAVEQGLVSPALLWLNAGKPWVYGVILQHWWSFAGDDDRSHVNRTELQYIFRHAFEGGWSLGMGPNIVYDWTAEPDDRLTLPIGLGITKTVRIGKMPVKFRFEPQYSIIRPDSVGTEWNFRIQIAPVIRSPFSR